MEWKGAWDPLAQNVVVRGVTVPITETDRQFIQRCVALEPGAWQEFVGRYAALFTHVVQHTAHCRSVKLAPADLEDVVSDIFLAILANDLAVLRNFRGLSELSTYLAVIARRIAVHALTRRRMAEAMGHVPLHADSLEQAASDGQRIENEELVQAMLAGLSETEAAIVWQYHMEGRSYHDISQALGVPENSIGPLLTRAREKLRRRA